MIKVSKDSKLTSKNLIEWYKLWLKDFPRIDKNYKTFINADKLKMPFAKKMVLTSAAATLGDGITVSAPEDLDTNQKATFEEIQSLWKKQTIINHDAGIIKYGCTCGRSYELCYMSEDEVPVPKTARIKATNAFVVFDDTVEDNSLYGVYFDFFFKTENTLQVRYIKFYIYDSVNRYEYEIKADFINQVTVSLAEIPLELATPHNMGRMPLTEVHNNEEEQSDFEQVIPLIEDRSTIHDKNFKDLEAIAKNYIKSRNIKSAADTDAEKNVLQKKAADNQRIEFETKDSMGEDNPNDDINILSKNENYSSITEYGKDVDSKIYDLSMIPDLTSQEFAGNLTGVALDLKLLPFKEMVATKEPELEKTVRRRLKMYMYALIQRDSAKYADFDVALCSIKFNRNWSKNILEIVQVMSQLNTLGGVSDKTIINLMPGIDYDDEQEQLKIEQEEKAKQRALNPDANNSSLADFNGILRGMQAGVTNDNSTE